MSTAARRYFVRGQEALARNDLDSAIESFRSALELAPWFASARIACAVALARFGDGPQAAQLLRAGLGHPVSPVTEAAMWATLGDVLTVSGDLSGAENAFQQAAMHPDFAARASSGRARVHARLGRYDEAFAHLKRAAAQLAAEDADRGT